jgi:hypothetical protein
MALMESHDPEMGSSTCDLERAPMEVKNGEEECIDKASNPLWFRVLNFGVEQGGIAPIPLENRTDTRYLNLLTVWFTALLCLLPQVSLDCFAWRYC